LGSIRRGTPTKAKLKKIRMVKKGKSKKGKEQSEELIPNFCRYYYS